MAKHKIPDERMTQAVFDNNHTLVSSQDCTGLIPGAPHDAAQAEALSELEDIPEPKI